MLVGSVTACPPLLAGVIEQFPHGDWTRDRAQQSDEQPLNTQSQAGTSIVLTRLFFILDKPSKCRKHQKDLPADRRVDTAEGGCEGGNVGEECDQHGEEERDEKYWQEYAV